MAEGEWKPVLSCFSMQVQVLFACLAYPRPASRFARPLLYAHNERRQTARCGYCGGSFRLALEGYSADKFSSGSRMGR